MATFKITVDDSSKLGQHIASLTPKTRSREIYMLASMGLMQGSQLDSSEKDIERTQVIPVIKNKEVAAKGKKKLVSDVDSVGVEKNEIKNHALSVDFGDEIANL